MKDTLLEGDRVSAVAKKQESLRETRVTVRLATRGLTFFHTSL